MYSDSHQLLMRRSSSTRGRAHKRLSRARPAWRRSRSASVVFARCSWIHQSAGRISWPWRSIAGV